MPTFAWRNRGIPRNSQDSWSPGQDLNSKPFKYEGVLNTRQRRSVLDRSTFFLSDIALFRTQKEIQKASFVFIHNTLKSLSSFKTNQLAAHIRFNTDISTVPIN
jgi:hypothetical protein